jgi:cytochrome b involved in lipid metabolism
MKVPGQDGKSLLAWKQVAASNELGNKYQGRVTKEQVSLHNTTQDYWCILHGQVYDLTLFLAYHPGGTSILKPYAGKDVTVLFEKYHPWVNFEFLLRSCHIGPLVSSLESTRQ